MWLLILEALAALSLLGLAVWWTMFSGRRKETDEGAEADADVDADANADPVTRKSDKAAQPADKATRASDQD